MILELARQAHESGARLSRIAEELGLSRKTLERWRKMPDGGEDRRTGPSTPPRSKLSEQQRELLLEMANSAEFRELSPKQIVPRLADQGVYLASESTFYRVLRQAGMMKHREPSRPRSPTRQPRSHTATAVGQVWTWDITYLRSPIRGSFYYLYMVEDIYSRKIVGWEVHTQELSDLASQLIRKTCKTEAIRPDKLVLHSDNGSPMRGSTLLATLRRLGVEPSYSRPRTSNDNPYSEALFRTLKYRPQYPTRPFESLTQAQTWVEGFVHWYNEEHRHSALNFVTPSERHAGLDVELLARRHELYERARRQNPHRWSGASRNWSPIGDVTLNPENRPATADENFSEGAGKRG